MDGAPVAYGPSEFARDTLADSAAMVALQWFEAEVERANVSMNLIGPGTVGQFWSRHALDSAQLLRFAPAALSWADLGAGAGFPGVVLAVLLKGRKGARVHLIDSVAKRCRFLAAVVEALDLPAEVHNARAEALALKVEVVTARACAPLERLLAYAQPYIARGAEGLFLKGESVADEVSAAKSKWRFDAQLSESISDPRGRVVRIRRLDRV